MTYWQVAAGARGRDYSDLFFDYGIMCVGGEKQINFLKEVDVGDKVVLKRGVSEILGVGVVQEKSQPDEEWLGDFDGWTLSEYAKVVWHRLPKPLPVGKKHTIKKGLAQWTIKRVYDSQIQKETDNIISSQPAISNYLPRPDLSGIRELKDKKIIKFLINNGFRPANAEVLTNTFNRIRLLAKFYYKKCDWEQVREHETRTFLVMPLLFALGYSEQQIKIELPAGDRKRIDIAIFDGPYYGWEDDVAKCKLIIETKGFSFGLDNVEEQAIAYAKSFPKCEKVVVTNGFCYKVYPREKEKFCEKPSAVMNLLKPKDKHPLYMQSEGALTVFKELLP